jgi:hypothetical protein
VPAKQHVSLPLPPRTTTATKRSASKPISFRFDVILFTWSKQLSVSEVCLLFLSSNDSDLYLTSKLSKQSTFSVCLVELLKPTFRLPPYNLNQTGILGTRFSI